MWNSHWFRSPPKVRMVPGILGPRPKVETRGAYQVRGESIEVGHRDVRNHTSGCDNITREDGGQLDLTPFNFQPQQKTLANLSRFVGHLWKGAPAKSYAAAVRVVPAPTVRVDMQNRGGGRGNDSGQSRGGFGGGFPERGRGRMPPRNNSWKRKDGGMLEMKEGSKPNAEPQGKEDVGQNPDPVKSRWEGQMGKQEDTQSSWAKGNSPSAGHPSEGKPQQIPSSGMNERTACEKCGMYNHNTQDCRRQFCERCGFANHNTFDCKKCLPWHYGPELCATQVEDQSFFYIDECIDPRVAREKSSTAVISVVSGDVNAKLIEMEFTNLIGGDS